MTAQQHLWRQLKQRDLLKETRPNADNRLKFKMLYIPCRQLKESVRAFYLNLVNDVSFVARLDSFERDLENYKYMREKLKLELATSRLDVRHILVDQRLII